MGKSHNRRFCEPQDEMRSVVLGGPESEKNGSGADGSALLSPGSAGLLVLRKGLGQTETCFECLTLATQWLHEARKQKGQSRRIGLSA